MQGIAYLAAIGGSIASILIARLTFRRFDIGGKRLARAAVAGGAILAGCLAYFVFGLLLLLLHPEHSQQNWSDLYGGFGGGSRIIMFATIATVLWRPRSKTKAVQNHPEQSVRERLLKARGDIQERIENLQASPVLNYRGGIPEPDIIIEELTEKLKEIDAALATPEAE